MKRNLFILSLFLSFTLLGSAQNSSHFITDGNYRTKVEKDFNEKMQLIGNQFFQTNGLNSSNREIEALKFLYAYMPMADATDYSTAFHLANVRASMQAREEMAWGEKVPELLFRHFVLPLRVNNENLDLARIVFYKELKERVRGMSMKDAILEVNH